MNLLSLRAHDLYEYALTLLRKEEMARSLVKKTKRSDKTALDEGQVKLNEGKQKHLYDSGTTTYC